MGTVNLVLTRIDQLFAQGIGLLEQTLFLGVYGLPLIIVWLLGGSLFLTLRMGFVNVRGFGHAMAVVRGVYDPPGSMDAENTGEVSHFQALATALSATVGLGNIAGVAIAIQLGGPGAVLWMTVAGLLGMTSKFVECTLAQKYRIVTESGLVMGGPMIYLSQGLADMGLKPLGQLLAGTFAVLCVLGSLGGGNMFQANQSGVALVALANRMEIPTGWGWSVHMADYLWLYGFGLALLVGLVIIGGIQRIATVASAVVPTMAGVYVIAAVWILILHGPEIPTALQTIWQSAWHPQSVGGGVIGVMVQGLRRGVFSNEAGIGSAAIAHAATRTEEPVRAGLVALLEPFIDTVVICNLTALVCLVTGVYQSTNSSLQGVDLTAAAFAQDLPLMGWGLAVIICLFSFSTIISWFYYGESSWRYLFGECGLSLYKTLYIVCVFMGTITSLGAVLTFSDMMMFAMGFPSMAGALLLSNLVARDLQDYWQRL